MSDIEYSWSFEDKKNRSTAWYIIAFSITIGLAIWGFLSKQYGMSFIVLLIAGLVYFVENNSEDEIHVTLTSLGIKLGTSFYDYSKIKGYSLIYNGEQVLYLRLYIHKGGIKNIDLKIDNKTAEDLQKILPNYISEESKGELSFSEKMISLLKL